MPSRRLTMIATATTIASSSACASTHSNVSLPEPGGDAPTAATRQRRPVGSPVDPNAVSSITLKQLLVYASAHSPAIGAAEARVGLADAEIEEAKIALPANPQLRFGGGGRTVDRSTAFEFEVAVQQQLEVAGEAGLRRVAARDRRRLMEAIVDEVRWSVHVEVHRIFMSALLVEERLAQAKRFVVFAKSMRNVAASQIEAGESSPVVSLIAEADLARSGEAVIEAERARDSLNARLAAVIGWSGPTLPRLAGSLPRVRLAPHPDALLSLISTRHPSLRSRELAVIASKSRLALEERMAWAKPTVGVSYGREGAPVAGAPAHVWLFHVSVPVPLWRTNQPERARAAAALLVAGSDRDATAAQLRGELLQAAIAVNASAKRVSLYEKGVVPQLEKNLALLRRAFELGEVNVHQVSQTRERLLTATGQYLDARIAYYEAAATLEGLVGAELWPHAEAAP